MADMKLEPQGDRILVRPIVEEVTTGGIIIPDAQDKKEKQLRGVVWAVGKDIKDFKEGDKIRYGKYAGQGIKVGDEMCLIMRGDDVLMIEREN